TLVLLPQHTLRTRQRRWLPQGCIGYVNAIVSQRYRERQRYCVTAGSAPSSSRFEGTRQYWKSCIQFCTFKWLSRIRNLTGTGCMAEGFSTTTCATTTRTEGTYGFLERSHGCVATTPYDARNWRCECCSRHDLRLYVRRGVGGQYLDNSSRAGTHRPGKAADA